MPSNKSKIVGIDLGTTNSLVAIVEDGKPKIITDTDGENRLIPSVVGISPEGELLVGQTAKNQYVLYPERTVRSIKRKMGTLEKVRMGDKEYTPPEISAFILRKLKNMAEDYMGEPVSKAVITVPAYFNDAQRQATKDAGEIAGLEVVRIINEPTAAALAYGLDRKEEQFVLVYDLGGGTFDVSIVEMSSGVLEVRASHGNTRLGGDDFDQRIVDRISDWFKEQHKVDLREERRALARLLRSSEAAKIILSNDPYARIIEEFIAQKDKSPLHLDYELSRFEFESLIDDLINSTVHCIDVAMKDAELAPPRIGRVLLVGGSTRIPLVQRVVARRMEREPHSEINPDEAVALGAAIQGAIIAGEKVDAILVDVTAHSLGIEVVDIQYGMLITDLYSVIIKRNTTLPVSRSEPYHTLHPEQKTARFKVYQGESPVASENSLLGEFLFENISKHPKGELAHFVVRFDMDINGILHVTATHKDTGRSEGITVTASRQRMSEAEKEAARQALTLWETPELVEAQALLRKAKRLVKKALPRDALRRLSQLIATLERALEKRDAKQCGETVEELLELMYELGGEEEV